MTAVALVPAKDNEGTIAETVAALLNTRRFSAVVVVDDGSADATAARASEAGARVVRLRRNCGKGAALAVGLSAAPDADVYVLVDADTGDSSRSTLVLLDAVEEGSADLAIGVLPSAAGRGGFGLVKKVAADGIRRLCGLDADAPLSGQRAVDGALLRRVTIEQRFGVEVAMTVDVVRSGARVAELPVDMEHDHRGRSWRGFLHRGRQGLDIVVALLRRSVPSSARLAIVVLLACAVLWAAFRPDQPDSRPLTSTSASVALRAVPGLTWSDVRSASGGVRPVAAGSYAVGVDGRVPAGEVMASFVPPTPNSGETVVVFGVGAPGDKVLRPVLVYGTGESGLLTSPATRRAGLITADDLDGLMSVTPATDPVTAAAELPAISSFYDRMQVPFIVSLVTLLVAAYSYALFQGRRGASFPGAGLLARAVIAVPPAAFLVRATGVTNPWLWSALVTVAVGIISVMAGRASGTLRAGESILDRSGPLRRILLATVALLTFDVVTGSGLQLSGVFGSAPSLGARFYGLGNPASVLLLTALTLWCALHVRASIRRTVATVEALVVFVVVTAAVVLPSAGADVGAIVSYAVAGSVLFLALFGRRLRLSGALAVIGSSAAALAVLGAVDAARPADAQSHLGRLFDSMITAGPQSLLNVIGDRAAANFLGYGFPVTMLGALAVAAVVFALLRTDFWTGFLPVGSVARHGVAAAFAGALVMFLFNDSGLVVLALSALTVGPVLLAESESRSLIAATMEVEPK